MGLSGRYGLRIRPERPTNVIGNRETSRQAPNARRIRPEYTLAASGGTRIVRDDHTLLRKAVIPGLLPILRRLSKTRGMGTVRRTIPKSAP